MNNRQKMYQTNTKVRKELESQGFTSLYFFPHLRYSKDYLFEGHGFDGMGWKGKTFHLFQIKTNRKPTKKIIEEYKKISKKYSIKLIWINRKKNKLEFYGYTLKWIKKKHQQYLKDFG